MKVLNPNQINLCTTALLKVVLSGVLCTLLASCVTESSGGLPPPAPQEERVRAQLDLARGYLGSNEVSSARDPLEKALEIDPLNVEAHVLTGYLYQREQDNDLAEIHFRRALSIEPHNAQALNNYGGFLFAMGRFTEALVPLRALVEDPTYRARGQAFENLGLALLQTGNDAEAKAAFNRALELGPNQSRSVLELSELAYQDGELKLALELYDRYLLAARQNGKSLCLGLKLGTAVGNADQVASYGLALKRLFPDQADRCQVKS